MPNLYLRGQTTSKSRVGNAADVQWNGTRDGAAYVADYVLAMALEGRVFNARVGTATTVATFLATWVESKPQLEIDVPSGTTIIPLRMQVYLETSAGALPEIFATAGNNLIGAGTSTAVTPTNSRTDAPVATNCTVNSLYSAAGTTQTGQTEFWHTGYAFVDATGNPIKDYLWIFRDNPQILVGPASLALYVSANGNTAPTGFIRAEWIEVPSSSI